jgi:hypothetical protein
VTNKKIKFLATELKIGGTYKLTTVSGKKKSASVKLG